MVDSLLLTSPILLTFVAGMVIMLWEAIARPQRTTAFWGVAMATLLLVGALNVYVYSSVSEAVPAFGDMLRMDRYGAAFAGISILAGLFALSISDAYLERLGVQVGEYYTLVLFSVVGMMLMGFANDLMMVFISIEIMSIAVYVLCSIKRGDPRSVESGFKYFILGAFASAVLLYGVALIYGVVGSTSLTTLAHWFAANHDGESNAMMMVGGGLVLAGFGFKVASAPFHMGTPDVYQGAPTSITSLMSTGVKAASFAAFGRVVFGAMGEQATWWEGGLWWMAALTMLVGNIGALVQDDLKRMFAYSSIAHAGYLLMALVAASPDGPAANPAIGSLIFYALTYTFMSAGTFAVLSLMISNERDTTDIRSLNGLGHSNPWLAAGMSICLLSMAGIPPTMGFVGKFYLFQAAIHADQIGLAVVGALAAAAGVYYYLRPMVHMYMRDGHPELAPNRTAAVASLGLACVALLIFGLMPSSLLAWAEACVQSVLN